MKRLLILLFFLACYAYAAAAPITVAWDANAPSQNVEGYRLYRVISDTESELLAETTDLEATFEGEFGDSVFLTAFRGTEESERSDTLVILPALSKPSGLRIKVTVEINQP